MIIFRCLLLISSPRMAMTSPLQKFDSIPRRRDCAASKESSDKYMSDFRSTTAINIERTRSFAVLHEQNAGTLDI